MFPKADLVAKQKKPSICSTLGLLSPPAGVLSVSPSDQPFIGHALNTPWLALLDDNDDLTPSTAARGYCQHCGLDALYHIGRQQRAWLICHNDTPCRVVCQYVFWHRYEKRAKLKMTP